MRSGWLAAAALSGAAAVTLGSLGSHAIPFGEGQQANWLVAERYHHLHTLVLLFAALVPRPSRSVRAATWGIAVGMVLFSGSLYLRAGGMGEGFSKITPVGGVVLIAAWLLLAAGALRTARVSPGA